ncbi:MAG: efflux RND transporter periplasmic adaptor subunit [Pseudomonadota bacterium]
MRPDHPLLTITHRPCLRLSRHLALATTFVLAGCGQDAAPVKVEAQPVRVIVVGNDSIASRDVATGLVGSQEEFRLGFKTGGLISRMLVEAGDNVRAGQTLATLDTTETDAQVRQVSESLIKARRDAERADKLFKQGVLAEQVAQDARTQVAVMESNLSAARFNRQQAVIVAPANGVVLQRLAEAREVTAPGAPVLVVSRADQGWVLRVGLNDQAATRVKVGDTALVRLNAYPGQSLNSRVKEVGAASDPRTGTITVTLTLPSDAGLKYIAGQVGEAQLQSRTAETQHLTVPLSALLEGEGHRAKVYVIDDKSKAQRKVVATGAIQNDRVVIMAGLRDGERVVSEGAAWLNPGMPVRILR